MVKNFCTHEHFSGCTKYILIFVPECSWDSVDHSARLPRTSPHLPRATPGAVSSRGSPPCVPSLPWWPRDWGPRDIPLHKTVQLQLVLGPTPVHRVLDSIIITLSTPLTLCRMFAPPTEPRRALWRSSSACLSAVFNWAWTYDPSASHRPRATRNVFLILEQQTSFR